MSDLIDSTFARGSTDNITVMLVALPANIEVDDAAVQNDQKLNQELINLVDTFFKAWLMTVDHITVNV